MDEIFISGDLVVLRSVQVLKQTTAAEFTASLLAAAGLRTPVLPDGVVWHGAKGAKKLYLRSRRPGPAAIQWSRVSPVETKTLEVKLPWLHFLHVYAGHAFENLYVFCTKSKLDDAGNMLRRPPLGNLHSDCRVCLGNDLRFDLDGKLSGKLARVEDFFMNSVFNEDLRHTHEEACPRWLRDAALQNEFVYETLARLSASDSFDPCGMEWLPYRTLSNVADTLLGVER